MWDGKRWSHPCNVQDDSSKDEHGAVGDAPRRYQMQNFQYLRYLGQVSSVSLSDSCRLPLRAYCHVSCSLLQGRQCLMHRRWPQILVCKAWKKIIEDPLNQPDSVILLPEHMHISCLRALNGKVRSLELERDYAYDIGQIDQIVIYNCILTRAATLGVQHLEMSLAPPGHWALSMFLWGSLQTLRINFVGVHQLEEFAGSFSELSRLKVMLYW